MLFEEQFIIIATKTNISWFSTFSYNDFQQPLTLLHLLHLKFFLTE